MLDGIFPFLVLIPYSFNNHIYECVCIFIFVQNSQTTRIKSANKNYFTAHGKSEDISLGAPGNGATPDSSYQGRIQEERDIQATKGENKSPIKEG